MIRFHFFTRLMNGHFFRWKWRDQVKGFSRGAGEPGLVSMRLQNDRHPVGMHFGNQLVWFRSDDRGRKRFARLMPVNSIKKGPDSGKCEGWSRIFPFQPEPEISGRFLPFRLAKTGGRDETAPFSKLGFQKREVFSLSSRALFTAFGWIGSPVLVDLCGSTKPQ